ncbi:hypothetical protein GCM10027027_18470 [Neomicrococcus lactis]
MWRRYGGITKYQQHQRDVLYEVHGSGGNRKLPPRSGEQSEPWAARRQGANESRGKN